MATTTSAPSTAITTETTERVVTLARSGDELACGARRTGLATAGRANTPLGMVAAMATLLSLQGAFGFAPLGPDLSSPGVMPAGFGNNNGNGNVGTGNGNGNSGNNNGNNNVGNGDGNSNSGNNNGNGNVGNNDGNSNSGNNNGNRNRGSGIGNGYSTDNNGNGIVAP